MQIDTAARSECNYLDQIHNIDPAKAPETSKAWQDVIQRSEKARKPVPQVYGMDRVAAILESANCRAKFLASKESEELEKTLKNIVLSGRYKVLSYDVFDTLVLRNDKAEAHRYLELSERLRSRLQEENLVSTADECTAEDICLARVQALQVNYRIRKPVSGCVEGSIAEVIRIQTEILNLPEEARGLFLKEELEYEVDNLSPNPVLVSLAKEFARQGGRVVLVSDMYLDGNSIEYVVDHVLGERFHEKLFSSSDLVVSKRSGKIFKRVESDLGESPDKFIHFGDSLIGDVRRAREAGWAAQYFPVSAKEMERREKNLDDFVKAMSAKGFDVSPWAKI